MSWGEGGQGLTYLVPNFITRRARRGWLSSQDLGRGGHCFTTEGSAQNRLQVQHLTGSVSEWSDIRWVRNQEGSESDRFRFRQVWDQIGSESDRFAFR